MQNAKNSFYILYSVSGVSILALVNLISAVFACLYISEIMIWFQCLQAAEHLVFHLNLAYQ